LGFDTPFNLLTHSFSGNPKKIKQLDLAIKATPQLARLTEGIIQDTFADVASGHHSKTKYRI